MLMVCFLCVTCMPNWAVGQANNLGANLYVIVNATQRQFEAKNNDLTKILKGRQNHWQNGEKILIALMKPKTTEGAATAKGIYNMSSDELNKYWLKMVFQGKSRPPKFFSREVELLEYVKNTNGAIGVVTTEPPDDIQHYAYQKIGH